MRDFTTILFHLILIVAALLFMLTALLNVGKVEPGPKRHCLLLQCGCILALLLFIILYWK